MNRKLGLSIVMPHNIKDNKDANMRDGLDDHTHCSI